MHRVERSPVDLDRLVLAALAQGRGHLVREHRPLRQQREQRQRQQVADLPPLGHPDHLASESSSPRTRFQVLVGEYRHARAPTATAKSRSLSRTVLVTARRTGPRPAAGKPRRAPPALRPGSPVQAGAPRTTPARYRSWPTARSLLSWAVTATIGRVAELSPEWASPAHVGSTSDAEPRCCGPVSRSGNFATAPIRAVTAHDDGDVESRPPRGAAMGTAALAVSARVAVSRRRLRLRRIAGAGPA